ncbi:hypothetical protein A2U01_0021327 [Trifolium medium]|uniref:Uncharacterized protein n=1 Tax=Trifolium medium TaxID=97028 RepID=A0A392NMF4_9FABA|nr:hypothetical protein [Trifolium medium]
MKAKKQRNGGKREKAAQLLAEELGSSAADFTVLFAGHEKRDK